MRPRVPAPQHRLSTLEKSHFTDAQWDLPARRRCGEEMPVLHLSQRECRAVSAPPAAFGSATRSAQTPMGSRRTHPSPACTSSPWGLPWTYHWQLHLGLKLGQAPHLPQIHTPMDYRRGVELHTLILPARSALKVQEGVGVRTARVTSQPVPPHSPCCSSMGEGAALRQSSAALREGASPFPLAMTHSLGWL